MSDLYQHQKDFLALNPNKALICFEAGTGKTRVAVEWLRDKPYPSIVIVPKRIKLKWQGELSEAGVQAIVITKEAWKKSTMTKAGALVIDEIHQHASPLFTKGRSQLATRTYNFIKDNPDMPILGLTATPISSTPANLHTLLVYIGHFIPWKDWRQEFYNLEMLPYLPRPAYMPKKNWRILIRPYLLKYTHTALMSDVAELPLVTEETISVAHPLFVKGHEATPMAEFVAEHRNEQLEKAHIIRDIGGGYRKVVVVAYFRDQIEDLEKELKKDKQTYVLTGDTKDPEEVIRQAQEDEECYLICQSSIGVGFDLNTFAVMIFASQGYSYVSLVQMKARIQRIHDLKPVKYIYLISGRCDKAVQKQLLLGRDFDVKYFND
ncbi:MAG TPA: helicase-related protein [Ferruginibacter sp.]|nr:helicase-related protein [Ferruginibacter sp.]